MTYLVIQVKAPQEITPLERKKYINSLYDDNMSINEKDNSIGFFRKFSYALGYKPYDDYKYTTPDYLISENLYAYPEGEILFEFFIEKGVTSAYDNSFSYGNGTIAGKWADFLKKVFPQLEVSIYVTKVKPNRETWLTSYFFKSIENFPVSIETSIGEKLNDNELESIKKIVDLFKDYPLKFKLLQYKCSTCEEYDSNSPIHLELLYSYNNAHRKDLAIKNDWNYSGPSCFCCMNSVSLDEDLCENCKKELKNTIIMSVN